MTHRIAMNIYDNNGEKIVETREYDSASALARAIRRAQKAGKIAMRAETRTDRDPPTVHH